MRIHFEVFPSVEHIDRNLWNELAAAASPTMEWEYFYCLEKAGVVCPEKGYRPRHVVAFFDDVPAAIAPLYERDRAWLEFGDGGLIQFLSELTGLPFYLGLSATIPFTPVPGYRFLCRSNMDSLSVIRSMLDYIDYLCHTDRFLTSRIYFLELDDPRIHNLLLRKGYICIKSEYCLWFNRGYRCFDDYLGTFRSSRRRKIKRELREIEQRRIRIEMMDGSRLAGDYYRAMHRLYEKTWRKHMGIRAIPFLNEDFFRLLGSRFGHRCRFSIASQGSERLALAIFYEKGERLFGRYWGNFEDVPFLHFATCYYYPIMYAIENGIRVIDPGFGGDHKIYRGFQPVNANHYVKFHGEEPRQLAHSIVEKLRMGVPVTKPH